MMIKENKLKYIISMIIIILPSVVALFIKEHAENMMRGAWYFTWLMPVIFAVMQTALLIFTSHIDPVKQSKKIENIIFFILPTLSLYMGSVFIALILGVDLNIGLVCSILVGVSFIVMGNYFPKAKRNRTFGIKIRWTLANDDNWVATHRLGGKLFVIAGFIMLLCGLLPAKVFFIALAAVLVLLVVIPIVYSYTFYKRQIADGTATKEDYSSYPRSKADKKAAVIGVVIGAIVLIGVVVMMFVGSISYTFTDDELKIKTTYGGSADIDYDDIVNIEYREGIFPGMRVSGFASSKLLFGWFKNDEIGNYNRYTYTKSESAILIYTEDEIVVIADETAEDTHKLYSMLLLKVASADD